MKTLLALIFALLVCPFFAAEKADNAVLLSHLKGFRAELMIGINKDKDRLASNQLADFMQDTVNKFYKSAEKILQKILTDEMARLEFEVICNNILPFPDIIEKFQELPTYQRMEIGMYDDCGDWRTQTPVEIDERVKKDLYALFVPVFEKAKKPSIFEQGSFSEDVMRRWFNVVLGQLLERPEMLGNDWPLLKLIDAKIAELTAQV